MPFHHRAGTVIHLATALALFALSPVALAGERPQVDLSVHVTTTPEPFVPGDIATVTMTVYNAGPDTAGAVLPGESWIIIREKPYGIVDQPPPFLLFEPANGCSAYTDESEYNPSLPGGGISLLFSYWFDAIPAGQSRTCIYRIRFLPSTRMDFATYWRTTSPNDDDVNPSNNRFDYTFVAAPPTPPAPVPALSRPALLLLGSGALLAAMLVRRRIRQ